MIKNILNFNNKNIDYRTVNNIVSYIYVRNITGSLSSQVVTFKTVRSPRVQLSSAYYILS